MCMCTSIHVLSDMNVRGADQLVKDPYSSHSALYCVCGSLTSYMQCLEEGFAGECDSLAQVT